MDLIFEGIGRGPAKSKARVREDVVAYLAGQFDKVYRRDPEISVASFALSKTLQNGTATSSPTSSRTSCS